MLDSLAHAHGHGTTSAEDLDWRNPDKISPDVDFKNLAIGQGGYLDAIRDGLSDKLKGAGLHANGSLCFPLANIRACRRRRSCWTQ